MKMYHIKGIKWDTEGLEVDLPKECLLDAYDGFDVANDGADVLSDRYVWCVETFVFTEVPEDLTDEQFVELTNLPMLLREQ